MGIYLSAPTKSVPETSVLAKKLPAYRSILDILQEMGNPELNPRVDEPAFVVSKYFAPNRQEQQVTFRELYEEIATMSAVYRCLGLGESSKIALAETNSKGFFGSYFGGLAIGACMISINLLALQDESSKTRYLTHMLATPRLTERDRVGADLYVFGTDALFQKMYGFKKILKLKRYALVRNFLAPRIKRFAQELPPQGLLDKPVFQVLSKNSKTRKEKQDLQILFEGLPNHLKVLTPEEKAKLMDAVRPLGKINQLFPADKIAEVLYTSGTSGNPKGVALTHGNLAFTVESLTEGTENIIRDQEVLLMGLPFFHIFGKAVMLATLSRQLEVARQGGRVQVVVLPSLSKAIQSLDGVLKTTQDYQVTLLPVVPVFLEKLVQYLQLHPEKRAMFQTVRTIISGGAALKPDTHDTLKEWFPALRLIEGYGSSEAGINLLDTEGHPGQVGFPLPGVEVRLVPLDSLEQGEGELSDVRKGELWVRSGGVSQGYVLGTTDSPDLTIAREDGWFHSGDLVSYHPEYGFKIIGRESFFIKIDNEKRSPGELEDAIKLASPEIIDAFAVAHSPGIHEKAIAVVITPDANMTEESIKKAMQHLAKDNLITRWKIPKHLLLIHQDHLPARFDQPFKREATYKVIRQFVQELLDQSAIAFQESPDKPRHAFTEITNPDAFNRIVAQYNSL